MHPKELNIDFENKGNEADVNTKQNLLAQVLEGKWISRYKGRGMEFSEYRNYVYGDDASMIDWKATKKSNNTLVKVFEEDKSARVVFFFDVSDSMLFSSRKDGKMKAEYGAELIVQILGAILKSGNAVGLTMFNDNIVKQISPNIGAAVRAEFMEELRKPENYGGNFNFAQAMKYLLSLSGQKVIIIIVSDFIGLNPNWNRYVEIINQKFDVIGIMLRDHRDRYMPATGGQIVLEDPTTSETIYVDSNQYAKKYNEAAMLEEADIEKKFKMARSELLTLETTQDGFSEVVQFFKKRAAIKER